MSLSAYTGQAEIASRLVAPGQSAPVLTLPYARVFVCASATGNSNAGCSSPVTLYADANGQVPLSQPVLADAYGNFSFFSQAGLAYAYILSADGRQHLQVPIVVSPTVSRPPLLAYASQLGCALNGVTDDTALINAFLAPATSVAPRMLYMDGWAAVTGVIIPATGNCAIIGEGGFTLLNNSNQPVVSCGPWNAVGPVTPAPARIGSNIVLRDFSIYGNREGQNPTQAGGSALGYVHAVDMWNCVGVTISNLNIRDAAKYSINISNCAQVKIFGCECMPFPDGVLPTPTNTDGIHFCGPVEDFRIENCRFRTGDDAIAFNAPEGYGGNITRGVVANCLFKDAFTCFRFYPTNGTLAYRVTDIGIDNCSGIAQILGFNFGLDVVQSCTTTGAISGITISNCAIRAPRFCILQDNIGVVGFSDCYWYGGTGDGMVSAVTNSLTVQNLTLSRPHIVRDANNNGQISLFAASSSWLNPSVPYSGTANVLDLNLDGCKVDDYAILTLPPLPGIASLNTSSSIRQLTINGIDAFRVRGIVSPPERFANIAGIAGTGLSSLAPVGNDNIPYAGSIFNSSDGTSLRIRKLDGSIKTFTLT